MAQPSPPPSEEPYWLGRASDEQKRLLKQHTIWTRSIGYLVHPAALAALPAQARIADVGTGTGIWPVEMAQHWPAHTYHGLDISDAQFLSAATLPANVSLGLADFKAPFAPHLRHSFDLVNIRLIIISLGPEHVWKEVLANVLTLLKPGGVLTWTEGDFLVARGFRGAHVGAAPGHHLTAAQAQFNGTLRRRFGYSFPSLAALFEGAGLQDVREDVLSTDRLPEQRGEFTDLGIGAVFGGLRNLAQVKEEGYWDEAEVERRRALAVQDRESGSYLRWDIHVGIGFTPAS